MTEDREKFSQRFEDIPDCSLRYLLTIVASDDDLHAWAEKLHLPSNALIHLTAEDRFIPADETQNDPESSELEDCETVSSVSLDDIQAILGLDDEDEQRQKLEKTVIVAVNKGSIALALSVLFQQKTSVVLVKVEESGFSTPLIVVFAPQ